MKVVQDEQQNQLDYFEQRVVLHEWNVDWQKRLNHVDCYLQVHTESREVPPLYAYEKEQNSEEKQGLQIKFSVWKYLES